MSCVLKTTVAPRRRISSTASLSTSALTGSSPENGSSRISSAGLRDDRGDELHLLRHALRERLDLAVAQPVQLHAAPSTRRSADRARRSGAPFQPAVVAEQPADRHLLVEAALLGQIADAIARGGGVARPEHLDLPCVGQQDVHDHPQRRRLAGAVRADEAVDRAGRARSSDRSSTAAVPLNRLVTPRRTMASVIGRRCSCQLPLDQCASVRQLARDATVADACRRRAATVDTLVKTFHIISDGRRIASAVSRLRSSDASSANRPGFE